MKKILITGANSYIGTRLEEWLKQWPDEYFVETIDMLDGTWKEKVFSEFDVVFHVAGIVHIKETSENAHLYYEINRDLAVDTAKKAKADGVGHFVYLSTMNVYGRNTGIITRDSNTDPKTNYGKSKLQAEKLLRELGNDNYSVAILRPPMLYGKGCKGNYQTLSCLVKKTPFFPDYKNQRSLIYIDNLSSFVKNVIDYKRSGLFLPQNKDYVCTTEIVKQISKIHKHRINFTKAFNLFIKYMPISKLEKVFGTLIYKDFDVAGEIGFEDSIRYTEE